MGVGGSGGGGARVARDTSYARRPNARGTNAARSHVMARSFLPNSDAALLAWSANFSALISAGPVPLGLTSAMATSYATLHADFATKLAAVDPGVRNKMAVSAKNASRLALKNSARLLASIINGQATVTDAQKIELGLTVRAHPAPVPPPAHFPQVVVKSVTGRMASLLLVDASTPGRRGKPVGVLGASLFSHVGATPPTDLADWKFEGNTGRTKFDVTFPSDTAPGAMVWLTAFWFNPRKQSGPACPPVCTNLPGGSVSADAA